jgi:STE24 endopeptidase
MDERTEERAHRYSNLRYALSIADTVTSLVFLIVLVASGLSVRIADSLKTAALCPACAPAVYLFIVSLGAYLVMFPLHFYSTFTLEHRFGLSRQTFGAWMLDQVKASALSLVLCYTAVISFYWILGRFEAWWVVVSGVWILFSLVLAKLAPVLIIPLFFKQTKLHDETLRQRILALAANMKVKLLDVFEINFSSKTVKANAAMTGWGMTRRVLLGDTLKEKFTNDEVEVILAHEFAHYKYRHILKQVVISGALSLALFYLIFRTNAAVLAGWGYSSLSDIAALPVLGIYAVVFGIVTQPATAWLSRCFERQADKAALEVTGLKDAFISTMDKLADQNLSDRTPHPLIKFFFFTHPPISERIAFAKKS